MVQINDDGEARAGQAETEARGESVPELWRPLTVDCHLDDRGGRLADDRHRHSTSFGDGGQQVRRPRRSHPRPVAGRSHRERFVIGEGEARWTRR
jgi:hypothetical protein